MISIVDASNLERNLYLTIQLLEVGLPVVIALNMIDVAKSKGIKINADQLSRKLGVPIVPMIASKGEGISDLLNQALTLANEKSNIQSLKSHISYGDVVENELLCIIDAFKEYEEIPTHEHRWRAIKALERDESVLSQFRSQRTKEIIDKGMQSITKRFGQDAEIVIADKRYGIIGSVCRDTVRSAPEMPNELTDQIDAIATNKFLGIPIFLAIMYLVFHFTFTVGGPPMEWLDTGVSWLKEAVGGLWPAGSESLLKSLLVDGVIAGVGSVISFVPNIVLLFLTIAILEDSGYMARAAFIMDRLMHKIGLHGKSFIPFIIGFGCSTPAIMAARSLGSKRDRLLTILVAPLISCGARLPIYLLIIPAFFPKSLHTPMLALMYLIGIVLAVVCAKLLSVTILKGESSPLVMELPPYRMPTIKSTLLHTWERAELYITKVGTVILGLSIVLWFFSTFPQKKTFDINYDGLTVQAKHSLTGEQSSTRLSEIKGLQENETTAYTISGRLGHALEPVLKPIGFDWRIGTALVGAFAAKEVFVAQLGITYSVDNADETSVALRSHLQKNYTPLTAFCIMLYCLVSAPCMATFAITKRESGSWKWAIFQFGGMTALAYILTLIVRQIALILGMH